VGGWGSRGGSGVEKGNGGIPTGSLIIGPRPHFTWRPRFPRTRILGPGLAATWLANKIAMTELRSGES